MELCCFSQGYGSREVKAAYVIINFVARPCLNARTGREFLSDAPFSNLVSERCVCQQTAHARVGGVKLLNPKVARAFLQHE